MKKKGKKKGTGKISLPPRRGALDLPKNFLFELIKNFRLFKRICGLKVKEVAKVIEYKMVDFTFDRQVSRGEIFASKDIHHYFSYIADCDEMNIDDIFFVDNTGRFKLFRYGCETFAYRSETFASGCETFVCRCETFACRCETFACGSETFACGYETFACRSETFACGYETFACGYETFACGYETFACIKIADRFTDTRNSETWILYFLKARNNRTI
jgi:hypothetical protein